MSQLVRIGVAIDRSLLESFDTLIDRHKYTNRSEAFRDLIRDRLIKETTTRPDQQVVGTLTLVYDHHHRQLNDRLVELQHDFHHAIVSTLHVHLDHDNCLEVLVLQGRADVVRRVADALISLRGVLHGQLSITAAASADEVSSHQHR